MTKYLRKASIIKNILNNIFVSKLGLLEIPFVLLFEDSPAYERWTMDITSAGMGPVVFVMSDGCIDIYWYYGKGYKKDNINIYTVLESLSDIIGYSIYKNVIIDILYTRLKDINDYSVEELKLYLKLI